MNKLLTYLIIFSGLLLIPIMDVIAQENPDVVVVTTEGSGNTRQAAINDALALAVSQVNGISISANENSNVTSADVSTSSSYESANVMAGRVDTQGKVKLKKDNTRKGLRFQKKMLRNLKVIQVKVFKLLRQVQEHKGLTSRVQQTSQIAE